MKLLKYFTYLFFPVFYALFSSLVIYFVFDLVTMGYKGFYERNFSEPTPPPGYLICFIILLVLQLIFGTLPLLVLHKFNITSKGYIITGIATAYLFMQRTGGSRGSYTIFTWILFSQIILGYYFSYIFLRKASVRVCK